MWTNVFTQSQKPKPTLERLGTVLLILRAFLLSLLRKLIPDRTVRGGSHGKAVLITGCDRGIGFETAKCLDALGFHVFAGCLDVTGEGSRTLEQDCSSRLTTLQLDLTKPKQLDDARIAIEKVLGKRDQLWGIVNNAGVCYLGNTEIMTMEDTSQIIDVNFKGPILVTKAFLPLIRRSSGRIINIGSVNGDVPMPNFGVYNATKAALKMYSETLRYEMKMWGVQVSVIAPAGFKTALLASHSVATQRWWAGADKVVKEDYGRQYFNMKMRSSERIKVSADLSLVTGAVTHALLSTNPQPMYRVGQGASVLPALCKWTPAVFKDWFCSTMLNFCPDLPDMLKEGHRQHRVSAGFH